MMAKRPGPMAPLVSAGLTRFRRRLGRERVAFVLSGGGNLGAVQVGMLRALAEAGVVPDLVVGCSVGAINGASFAAQPDLAGVERLDRIWRRISDGEPDLMPSRRLPVLAQVARRGRSLHDPQLLAGLLEDELPTQSFSGLQVPFTCVAAEVETASEYWFDSGPLVPALLASAALPVVYPPVELGTRTLIDGGVLNEIPAARAVELGATELYILHCGHLSDRDAVDLQRPFDAARQAYWTARRFRLEEDLRRVPDHCIVHRLPAGSSPKLRFNDFTQATELGELAYTATAQYLRTGRSPAPVSGPVSVPDENELTEDPDGIWPGTAAIGEAPLDLIGPQLAPEDSGNTIERAEDGEGSWLSRDGRLGLRRRGGTNENQTD